MALYLHDVCTLMPACFILSILDQRTGASDPPVLAYRVICCEQVRPGAARVCPCVARNHHPDRNGRDGDLEGPPEGGHLFARRAQPPVQCEKARLHAGSILKEVGGSYEVRRRSAPLR